jgi:cold-inducible RNA-binding protein
MAKSLYVGGLPYSTDAETLRGLFAEIGAVGDVRLITDRETGMSKGFAFVEMANDTEALAAVQQLNGYQLDGRSLTVNEARPREERSGGYRGGGGGGYGGNRGGYR